MRTCCAGCLITAAVIVALFGPAAWFGTTGAILAYTFEGVLLAAGIWQWAARRRRIAPPAPTPPVACP